MLTELLLFLKCMHEILASECDASPPQSLIYIHIAYMHCRYRFF